MTFETKLKPLSPDDIDLETLFADGRMAKQIRFILEVEKLKTVLRMTPLLDASRRENDAEHTWELALMAVLLAEYADEPVDLARVVKMILIHDIVEIDAGDTFIYDAKAVTDQEAREIAAADRLFGLLPEDQAAEFRALWGRVRGEKDSRGAFCQSDGPAAAFAAQLLHQRRHLAFRRCDKGYGDGTQGRHRRCLQPPVDGGTKA